MVRYYCKAISQKTYLVGLAWHGMQKLAYSAVGNVKKALECKEGFMKVRSLVPKSRYLHNVTCAEMFAIAEKMIDGETEYRMEH